MKTIKRKKPGPKPTTEPKAKNIGVSLYPTHVERATTIGQGNMSEGMRQAIDYTFETLAETERHPTADEKMGLTWWNHLTPNERLKAAKNAGTAIAAEAWDHWKKHTALPNPMENMQDTNQS